MKYKYLYNFVSLLLFIVILVIWEALSYSVKFKFFFASPSLIWESIVTNIQSGTILSDTLITGSESILGFVIGIVLGTFFGFVLWYSPPIAKISRPYIFVFGTIPIFTLAPIIILWFGIGFGMKVALATFGVFFISLFQAYEGANAINLEEYSVLKLFGASRYHFLRKIVYPNAISWVFASLKLSINFAILGAFIGEFISAEAGLGHLMIKSGSLYDIPTVFAAAVFLILLALLLNYGVKELEKRKTDLIRFFSVDNEIRKISKEFSA
jgi:NitT/TauT family transport system permease protein